MEDTLFRQLKTVVEGAEADAIKFYEKGNKAAGTRLRKAMQEIKGLAVNVRKDVQGIKNSEKE
jgi:hypothetical protein